VGAVFIPFVDHLFRCIAGIWRCVAPIMRWRTVRKVEPAVVARFEASSGIAGGGGTSGNQEQPRSRLRPSDCIFNPETSEYEGGS
jgi:hypothetical protein